MPLLKLWMCTWNLEMAKGDDEELDCLAQLARGYDADLVVFALQEGKSNDTVARFGHALGYGNACTMGGFKGFTKFPRTAMQNMGVFAKDPQRLQFASNYKGWTGRDKKGKKWLVAKVFTEKGGMVALVDYDDIRCAFISSHLDAGAAMKRIAQIQSLATASGRLNTSANQTRELEPKEIDFVFFMGDLNFRMDLDDWKPINSKMKKKHFYSLKKEKQVDFYTDEELDMIFEGLLDAETRKYWFDRYDLLTGTGSSAAADYFGGFTFPDLTRKEDGTISLPTYKRKIGKGCPAIRLNQILGSYNPNMHDDGKRGMIKLVRDAYPKTQYNMKRGALDMGWLDRIGYKATGGDIWEDGCHDAWECYSGDHAPVFFQCLAYT